MDVTNFAGSTSGAGDNLAVYDDCSTNTGTDGNNDYVLIAFCAASPHFAKTGHIDVVATLGGEAGQLRQLLGDGLIDPVQICRADCNTIIRHRAGRAKANTGHIFFANTLFFHLSCDGSCNIRKDVGRIILSAGRDLPLVKELALRGKKTQFYKSTTNINTKAISHKNQPSS